MMGKFKMRNHCELLRLAFLILLLPVQVSWGQEIMFNINGVPAYSDEFEYAYSKNSFNNPDAFTKKDLQEYFDLYLNFKLKVQEAKSLKLDTIKSLKNEFESYKVQLRKPYMSDQDIMDSLVMAAYDRFSTEVNASHILLRLPPEPKPEDTLKVYNQIVEIRNRAVSGEDFGQLAAEFSQDPGGKINGGNLGYFTSMQMVFPFEDAAYNLKIKQISKPVRTSFGYHILKLNDRRRSKGRIQAAHIMVRFQKNMTAEDSLEKRDKIFEIHQQLKGGADWEQLCNTYSEDMATRSKGGVLAPFRGGNMPPTFSDAAFNLEPDEISDPFTTPFGWHIVKLIDTLGIEKFEEVESTIRSRINSDSRSQIKNDVLISKLAKENKVEFLNLYQSLKNNTIDEIDSSRWEEPLFTIVSNQYSIRDLLNSGRKEMSIKGNFERFILDYEEEHLVEKYPEYRHLLNEYWEGILLFQVMEQEIWNRAIQDSSGLYNYFLEHRDSYQWDERIEGTLFLAQDNNVLDSLETFLSIAPDTVTTRDLQRKYNEASPLALQVIEGPFEKGDKRLPKDIRWENHDQRGTSGEASYYFLTIKLIQAPGPKEFTETKGLVISDYQDYLEELWIKNLRGKYVIDIEKKNVKNVIKNLQK